VACQAGPPPDYFAIKSETVGWKAKRQDFPFLDTQGQVMGKARAQKIFPPIDETKLIVGIAGAFSFSRLDTRALPRGSSLGVLHRELALVGVYHLLPAEHLQRYLDEIAWRWNRRQRTNEIRGARRGGTGSGGRSQS
jgi:hypothetical protein